MVPTTTTALAIILTAIVPGYVTIYLWARNRTWLGLTNDLQTVLKSIALSAIIQLALLPYTLAELYGVRDQLDRHPLRVSTWLVLTVLVLPYLLGTVTARVSERIFALTDVPPRLWTATGRRAGMSRRRIKSGWTTARWALSLIAPPAAHPSVWDWAVSTGSVDGCYVVVTWQNGEQAAGIYGKSSRAITSPERQGIYLEQEWLLNKDGDFDTPVANSVGLILPTLDNIRAIRLLRGAT